MEEQVSLSKGEFQMWQPRFRNAALWALLFLGLVILGIHPALGERTLGFRLGALAGLSEFVGLFSCLTGLFCVLQVFNLYDQEQNSQLVLIEGVPCRVRAP